MVDKATLEFEGATRNQFISMALLRQQYAKNNRLNQSTVGTYQQWVKSINTYNEQLNVIVLGLETYLGQYRKEAIDMHLSLFTRTLQECTECFERLSNLVEQLSTRSNVRTETIAALTNLNTTVSDIKHEVDSLAQLKHIRGTQSYFTEYQLQCKTIIETIISATKKLQDLAVDGIRKYAIDADQNSIEEITTSEDDLLDESYNSC